MLVTTFLRLLPLGLVTYAAEVDEEIAPGATTGAVDSSPLAVTASASFPEAQIFGVKLVNGRPTNAVLSFTNNEPDPVSVRFIGGSLLSSFPGQKPTIIRNLSTTVYDGSIPPGESESYTYKFTTDMHPQDVRLNLVAMIMDQNNKLHPLLSFNETVGVVEAPSSILDPQNIFLYLVLAGFFGAVLYGIYSYWIVSFFPQQKRRPAGKGGERAKASSKGFKKVDPSGQATFVGIDGPAVTTGSKGYDESWIPQEHLKRPEARRIKSGTPSGVKTKKG